MHRLSFLVLAVLMASCGGSGFESAREGSGGTGADASDASAGTGGAGGTAGTAGTGGGTAGTGGGTAGTGGGTAGTGGAAGGPACDGQCVPMPPDKTWMGPIVTTEANAGAPPPCPDNYANEAARGGFDPTSNTPACLCVCSPRPNTEWRAQLIHYSSPNCGGSTCSDQTLPAGICTARQQGTCSATGGSRRLIAHNVCKGEPEGPSAWRWSIETRVCAPSVPPLETCGEEELVCMPAPSVPHPICLYSDGDRPCPPGPYSTRRFLRFANGEDQRTCGSCSCGSSGTVGNVTSHALAGCTGSVGPGANVPLTCEDVNLSLLDHLKFTPSSTTPACSPAGAPPLSGSVVPVDPITICCLE